MAIDGKTFKVFEMPFVCFSSPKYLRKSVNPMIGS